MIKVCHIITKLELGGAQQNTLYTIGHLDRQTFQPLLITGSEGLLIEEANQQKDVAKHYLPELMREIRPWHDARALYHIIRILRRERLQDPQTPLIVHTHSSKAGILGRWAAKIAGCDRIVHSIHGFGFHPYQRRLKRWLFIALEWLTSWITDHFIAVSSENLETGVRLRLFTRDQAHLIRSGIDIERFRSDASEETPEEQQQRRTRVLHSLHIPLHTPLIVMVACFKPQKAPLDFIRVIKIVSETFPRVHAIMLGDGILRPQIEALIAKLQLQETISLLGWRNDVAALLPLCRLFVLTSLWEGLPRVCPQAMAAGLPIVATRVNGIPEAVEDGVNGFLVAPGDVKGLAQKVVYLLQNPEKASEMGDSGRQRVQEFDIRRMVQQQEELYHSLICGGK